MKKIRILSAFLTLVMLFGTLATGTSAAWADKVDAEGNPIIDYLSKTYTNPEEKLADMVMVKEGYGYQLWYEEFTGEVALLDLASGQVLFTNPIDVALKPSTAKNVKSKLLSQIIINYTQNNVAKEMVSYTDAALRGQITLKNIKGGIRVEYTVGEPQTTRLVPRLIEKSRFEELILANIETVFEREKVASYYTLYDPNSADITERGLIEMQAKYPVTMKGVAVYVCKPAINTKELKTVEELIKKYCPLYTYDEMAEDHRATEYEGTDAAPPRFRLALEYTLVDGGMEVRLPANSIEFDESTFKLKTIQILPYLGAGSNMYSGYTMIPDGSGTLIRYEDLQGKNYNVAGQMYGADYAYHEISGQHAEVMRWPVWGNVVNYGDIVEPLTTSTTTSSTGTTTEETDTDVTTWEPVTYSSGYMALITEGDSLATLMSEHGGGQHPYNTVYAKFIPRPSDSYNLADSISVGSVGSYTVTSKRKYTDNYRIRYFMLTDENVAAEKGLTDYYSADWQGMAEALRDYWYDTGVLTKLENVEEDIPLIIESFGGIKTMEKVMSFPVEVDTPLTTFEDVKTMYNELAEAGIENIGFKLTGFANGTMDFYTYPNHVDWNEALGGNDGFKDLVAYANEKGFEIYPDFDFAYQSYVDIFDGVNRKEDAIKTIDGRYTVKRIYDPATQSFARTTAVCISPKSFEKFYSQFAPEYLAYENPSISVATLGTDLSSDFDQDDPYHREDNKAYTAEFLAAIDKDYKNVMLEGGNAYTLKYADIITSMSLESSQYVRASESIPFMGYVLHGSKVYTGTPTNMEGDINEVLLRSIENGAAMYFTLSHQNTSRLKENDTTNKYYSVNYEIWKEDLIEYYNILNDALHDVQDQFIVDHRFLKGERVPDADELEADQAAKDAAEAAKAEAEANAAAKAEKEQELLDRLTQQFGSSVKLPTTSTGSVDAGEEEAADAVSKYATTSGSIIYVEYQNGIGFILNYNSFSVTTEVNGTTYTVDPMGFIKLN